MRLYAEDPRTFLPQAGRIERLRLPTEVVRVDSGVEEGDEIGLGYDPMIAKLIAHATHAGRRRSIASRDALAETEVAGVTTNLPFLRWLVAHPVVRAGDATTAFLTDHPPLTAPPLLRPAAPFRDALAPQPPRAATRAAARRGRRVTPPDRAHGATTVTAPMPGTVIRVEVEPGDEIRARQPLVVLEAMKMEIPVASPFDGTVKAVHVSAGDRVAGGALIVELES